MKQSTADIGEGRFVLTQGDDIEDVKAATVAAVPDGGDLVDLVFNEAIRRSHADNHLVSLRPSALRWFDADGFAAQNLFGSPDQVTQRIVALRNTGATELAVLIVGADDDEAGLAELISVFAEGVSLRFADERIPA